MFVETGRVRREALVSTLLVHMLEIQPADASFMSVQGADFFARQTLTPVDLARQVSHWQWGRWGR